MFYIKKLIVTGDGKDASSVEFGPGLNIIHGPSNCGKSYIADCVDYMFGGKQMRIPADLGYDMITMIVSSEKGVDCFAHGVSAVKGTNRARLRQRVSLLGDTPAHSFRLPGRYSERCGPISQ